MAKINRPRFGSLQFWPRKRAKKAIPSVNWRVVKGESQGFLGLIGYKVGMGTAIVRDETPHSMTKGKKITLPVTILETPNMKIYSIRFYKNGLVVKDMVVCNDKELKKKIKTPKEVKKNIEEFKDFDDIRVIAFSISKQTGIKKTPDLAEVGISSENKIEFIKNLIGKEISTKEISLKDLVDVRGLTKGKGLSGPVARFGIGLKSHKSEKGRRRPGSLGPWHPARVTFRVPMAGQLGMFTRVHYNLKILDSGKADEKGINKKEGFKNYGKIKSNYLMLMGSVQGPAKRQVLITPAMRPSRKQAKKNYELVELRI